MNEAPVQNRPPATPENEFDGAQRFLQKYYRSLMREMAREIVSQRQLFESPAFDGLAGKIVEKYALQLQQLGTVFSNLHQFACQQKPAGKEPLGKDDFRCFKCGNVIHRDDESCPACAWTWK